MNMIGFGFPSPPLYGNGVYELASEDVKNIGTLDVVMTDYTKYKNKLLIFHLFPVTDDVSLYSRVSTNGGLTFDSGASDYLWGNLAVSATEAPLTRLSAVGDTKLVINVTTSGGIGIGNQSGEGISGSILFYDTTNQDLIQRCSWSTVLIEASITRNSILSIGSGQRRTEQVTNAIRLYFSSGNIASGSWTLYGYT